MVVNHNSGADQEEVNPLDGQKRWPSSTRRADASHATGTASIPAVMRDDAGRGELCGLSHLCHRNPLVYTAMFDYARMLIEKLGFDGFRFDFVKGFGAWMIGILSKYRYVKDGKEFMPYVVGEYWFGTEDVNNWIDKVNALTDNQISAFDFPFGTS